MFKVHNKNTRRRSGVFIVNFDYISHFFLAFLMLTLNKQMLAGFHLFSPNAPSEMFYRFLDTLLSDINNFTDKARREKPKFETLSS